MPRLLLVIGFLLAADGRASADAVSIQTTPRAAFSSRESRNYLNLRIGAASTGANGRPTFCGEIAPIARLSIEACGNGSRALHSDPIPELAHYRILWALDEWAVESVWLRPRLGAGFAELQVGEDAPGFFFGGTDAGQGETAGPEGVFSLQLVQPMGAGFDLIGDLNAGIAWLSHAGALQQPKSEVQPFAGLSLGVGF